MRVRKFSPIHRKYPIFEVCDDNGETIFFDVSVSDTGSLQVAFCEEIIGRTILADDFLRVFNDAKQLALAELNSN